jgi:predicted RNA-binding Zn-ribbon protein involved in translation (DUF1610 family)
VSSHRSTGNSLAVGKTDPQTNRCETQHDFNGGDRCVKCGVPRVLSPEEVYRLEKSRRGLPLQEYLKDGRRSRKHDSGATRLWCPKCASEIILVRPTRTKTRKARCADCGYEWNTSSREAFGGFRRVEVRG